MTSSAVYQSERQMRTDVCRTDFWGLEAEAKEAQNVSGTRAKEKHLEIEMAQWM